MCKEVGTLLSRKLCREPTWKSTWHRFLLVLLFKSVLVYFRSRLIHLLLSWWPNRAKSTSRGPLQKGSAGSARSDMGLCQHQAHQFQVQLWDRLVFSRMGATLGCFCYRALLCTQPCWGHGVSLLTTQLITHSLLITTAVTLYRTSLIALTAVHRDWIFCACLPFWTLRALRSAIDLPRGPGLLWFLNKGLLDWIKGKLLFSNRHQPVR